MERRNTYEKRGVQTVKELLEREVGVGNVQVAVSANLGTVGEVKRQLVAILIDGSHRKDSETEEWTYKPRTEEEMESLAALVREIIGFDSDRGDTVEMVNMEFPTETTEFDEIDSLVRMYHAQASFIAAAARRRFAFEKRLKQTVEELLGRAVGMGNVRAAVSADMDTTGEVKRQSVAVLVDGTLVSGEDGSLTYTPRTQEEMERLAALVRTAIGFNAERGDSIDVVNIQFHP